MFVLAVLLLLVNVLWCERCYLVLRRSQTGDVSFEKDWKEYQDGFGYEQNDFWIGLDKLFDLTKVKSRLKLRLFHRYSEFTATYDSFWIDSEDEGYRIHFSLYEGTAGDSLYIHNEATFCAKGKPDTTCPPCSQNVGWWFPSPTNCGTSNLPALKWNSLSHDEPISRVEALVCQESRDDFPDMSHSVYSTELTSTHFVGSFQNIPYLARSGGVFKYSISPGNGLDLSSKAQNFGDSILFSGFLDHDLMEFPNDRFQVSLNRAKNSMRVDFSFDLTELSTDQFVRKMTNLNDDPDFKDYEDNMNLPASDKPKYNVETFGFSLTLQCAMSAIDGEDDKIPPHGIYWKSKSPNRRENIFQVYEPIEAAYSAVFVESSEFFQFGVPVIQFSLSYSSDHKIGCISQNNPEWFIKEVMRFETPSKKSDGSPEDDSVTSSSSSTQIFLVPSNMNNPYNDQNILEGDTILSFCFEEEEMVKISHHYRFRHSNYFHYYNQQMQNKKNSVSLPSDFQLYSDASYTIPLRIVMSHNDRFYGILKTSKIVHTVVELSNIRIRVDGYSSQDGSNSLAQKKSWVLIENVDFYIQNRERFDGVMYVYFEFVNIWKDQFVHRLKFNIDYDVKFSHNPDGDEDDSQSSTKGLPNEADGNSMKNQLGLFVVNEGQGEKDRQTEEWEEYERKTKSLRTYYEAIRVLGIVFGCGVLIIVMSLSAVLVIVAVAVVIAFCCSKFARKNELKNKKRKKNRKLGVLEQPFLDEEPLEEREMREMESDEVESDSSL